MLLEALGLGGGGAAGGLLSGQTALLLGVEVGRGRVASHQAGWTSVATLDGGMMVAGQDRGGGCALGLS